MSTAEQPVTELVLFSGFSLNEAEAKAIATVKQIDGCYR